MGLIFEWDEAKALANLKKHRVSFDEAKTIFNDEFSITIGDPEHSRSEDRFVDLGMSTGGKLLVVVYTERAAKIRIISCRKATTTERKVYEEGLN